MNDMGAIQGALRGVDGGVSISDNVVNGEASSVFKGEVDTEWMNRPSKNHQAPAKPQGIITDEKASKPMDTKMLAALEMFHKDTTTVTTVPIIKDPKPIARHQSGLAAIGII